VQVSSGAPIERTSAVLERVSSKRSKPKSNSQGIFHGPCGWEENILPIVIAT